MDGWTVEHWIESNDAISRRTDRWISNFICSDIENNILILGHNGTGPNNHGNTGLVIRWDV